MKTPKKHLPAIKQKAAANRAKALKAADIAAELQRHHEEAEAASGAASDTADRLRLHLLEIVDHSREVEALAAAHEQDAVVGQTAPEPAWSGSIKGIAGLEDWAANSTVDLQASAIYSGQFIPDGGREIVKEDVPTVKKTFWQKIQDWWDNLWC